MPILRCPHAGCEHSIRVGNDQAGQSLACPDGHAFRVPSDLASRTRTRSPEPTPKHEPEIDDWAKLEQSCQALDQRLRLACSECGHEFATRWNHNQTFVNCPECGEVVSCDHRVRQSDADETVAARQRIRRRKQSRQAEQKREDHGWSVLERGLGHIIFAATVMLGFQIWAAAAIGPLIIPLIVAAEATHLEQFALTFLIFHGLVVLTEGLLLAGVFFHHDEILGALGNKWFVVALACGVGVYWAPRLSVSLGGLCSIFLNGALLMANIVVVVRASWGILLCLLAPVRWHLRLLLLSAVLLAIASSVAAFHLQNKIDFLQLMRPQNVGVPFDWKPFERPFLLVVLGSSFAHLLFAEFIRQVIVTRGDSASAAFVSGYQGWFVVLVMVGLLAAWIVKANLLANIAIAFVVIGLAVADIALRNRFIIALETARVRC